MLNIIGLGYNIDPTMKGLELIDKSDEVYLETYTTPILNDIKTFVEKQIKKEIILIDRSKLESNYLIERAKQKQISLLVIGDPFFATTHISLIVECKRANINVNIVNNASIFNAIGKTGLSLYKFGRTVTLSYWRENYKPTSPFDFIIKNKSIGLHTLVLLDVAEDKGPMSAYEGLNMLKEMEKIKKVKILDKLFVLSRIGFEDERINYGDIDILLKKDLGSPLFSFIIPGELNNIEREFISYLNV